MRQYTTAEVIAALQKSKGTVFVAAKSLGCTPQTIYNHAKKSPSVRAAMENERGESVDIGELKLMEAVRKGESWAVQFLLKTLGKDRGYTERLEIDVRYVQMVKQLESLAGELGADASELFNDYLAELSAARSEKIPGKDSGA